MGSANREESARHEVHAHINVRLSLLDADKAVLNVPVVAFSIVELVDSLSENGHFHEIGVAAH